MTDASGKRRLDDEEDFVRMEIVAALQRNIRVIPVLVDGARMPGKHDLPEALASLSRRNAIELSETRFHADVNRLIEAIEKSFAVAEEKKGLSSNASTLLHRSLTAKNGGAAKDLRTPESYPIKRLTNDLTCSIIAVSFPKWRGTAKGFTKRSNAFTKGLSEPQ